MRGQWAKSVRLLRDPAVQSRLLQHGDLSLCLKINSHWVFSDMVYQLYPGQPEQCFPEKWRNSPVIDPLLGMSPTLFNVFANTTKSAAGNCRDQAARNLFGEAVALKQHCPLNLVLSGYGKKVIEDVAKAYAHAAVIYILCRLERYGTIE